MKYVIGWWKIQFEVHIYFLRVSCIIFSLMEENYAKYNLPNTHASTSKLFITYSIKIIIILMAMFDLHYSPEPFPLRNKR